MAMHLYAESLSQMHSIEAVLQQAYPVLPVLVLNELEDAVPLAQALYAGGARVVEVTLRTPVALQAVTAMRNALPELIVGVGTVVRAEQLEQAKVAGAQFAVSPGFSVSLCSKANELDMAYLPAIMTASEAMQAMEQGYNAFKLYPASIAGSRQLLESFAGPFSELKFCPTGGITLDNLNSFLELSNVLCCGGTWLAPDALVKTKQWEQITALVQQAHAQVRTCQ